MKRCVGRKGQELLRSTKQGKVSAGEGSRGIKLCQEVEIDRVATQLVWVVFDIQSRLYICFFMPQGKNKNNQ